MLETVQILMKYYFLWHFIMVFTVCQIPVYNGLKQFMQKHLSCGTHGFKEDLYYFILNYESTGSNAPERGQFWTSVA